MSSNQQKDYVSVIYNEEERPITKYPDLLARYLVTRYGLSNGQKILDIGCGRGEFLRGFIGCGLKGYGVDQSLRAKSICPEVEILQSDLEKEPLPYKDNSFDVVFSKSVIEHLFDPENFMRECYRILKPGGRIIIMTPDWISQMKIFFDDYTHRQPYTVTAVKDILNILGFKEVSAELFYQLPVLWRFPALKALSRALRLFVPGTIKSRIKFVRWSVELMILGTGIKLVEKNE